MPRWKARHRGRTDACAIVRIRAGSFGQSRFPETLDQQLGVGLSAASDIRGYCESGIALKHERCRFAPLRGSSEMGELSLIHI